MPPGAAARASARPGVFQSGVTPLGKIITFIAFSLLLSILPMPASNSSRGRRWETRSSTRTRPEAMSFSACELFLREV